MDPVHWRTIDMRGKRVSVGQNNPGAVQGPERRPVLRHWNRTRSLTVAFVACFTLGMLASRTIIDSSFSVFDSLVSRTSAGPSAVLECFQVSPPVLTPHDAECTQVLMVHSFANSYGNPYVGHYVPPTCGFDRVIFNLTVTAAGRQFDRLGIMYFNDTEIFRLSTAEPTATGIEWTYLKDMSNFLPLFRDSQKIIFDLGNLVNDIYTSPFNTTLTATFLSSDAEIPKAADLILPVSARRSSDDMPSAFNVPDATAINSLSIPSNVKRAVFSIAACGQATEEFWWSNVLSSNIDTFHDTTTLYGFSPFREVQLLIDGALAGVCWPFPVIFTGGVVPGFWRPIVGIDAFDLKEDEIDITPFLPLLCDGTNHTFEIRIAGISDDVKGSGQLTSTVGSYWVVTGKIFIWLDAENYVTLGKLPSIDFSSTTIDISSTVGRDANGTNSTLQYQVAVRRNLSIITTIRTSDGSQEASWKQFLSYKNTGDYKNLGNVQLNIQATSGEDVSSSGYTRSYRYPLWANTTYATFANDSFTIEAEIDRSKEVTITGHPTFPSGLESGGFGDVAKFQGSALKTRQNGTATYLSVPSESRSAGFGSTEQDLRFSGILGLQSDAIEASNEDSDEAELYHRHVLAENLTIVTDEETWNGEKTENHWPAVPPDVDRNLALLSIHDMLGRGPLDLV